MDDLTAIGRWIIVFGMSLVLIGGIVWLAGRLFGGNLPGTIRIQTSGLTCIIPLLASLILSIVLTVILNIIVRIINR